MVWPMGVVEACRRELNGEGKQEGKGDEGGVSILRKMEGFNKMSGIEE